MTTRIGLILGVWFSCVALTSAQPYIIEQGEYAYLHSPWLFNVEGCNYEMGCPLSISGLLALPTGNPKSVRGFSSIEIEISGNDDLLNDPRLEQTPIASEPLRDFLLGRSLRLVSDDGDAQDYGWADEWLRGDFQVSVSSDTLRLTGGYDHRPADGDGVFFNVEARRTRYGDANLDFLFDSSDLVQVFTAATYEDDVPNNSKWSTGDWNGDGDFTSSDLVLAFIDLTTERAAVASVPEPTDASWAVMAIFAVIARISRQKHSLYLS